MPEIFRLIVWYALAGLADPVSLKLTIVVSATGKLVYLPPPVSPTASPKLSGTVQSIAEQFENWFPTQLKSPTLLK